MYYTHVNMKIYICTKKNIHRKKYNEIHTEHMTKHISLCGISY